MIRYKSCCAGNDGDYDVTEPDGAEMPENIPLTQLPQNKDDDVSTDTATNHVKINVSRQSPIRT